MRGRLLLLLSLTTGCVAPPPPARGADAAPPRPSPTSPAPPESPAPPVELVDPRYSSATAGEPGWEFASRAEADLDGDGATESVTLVANVGVDRRGEPMWDDGQVWQAYVLEPDGARTDLYRRFVQLGQVALAITEATAGDRPTVLLTETTPFGLTVLEIGYRGPGDVEATVAFERRLRAGGQPIRPPG